MLLLLHSCFEITSCSLTALIIWDATDLKFYAIYAVESLRTVT